MQRNLDSVLLYVNFNLRFKILMIKSKEEISPASKSVPTEDTLFQLLFNKFYDQLVMNSTKI